MVMTVALSGSTYRRRTKPVWALWRRARAVNSRHTGCSWGRGVGGHLAPSRQVSVAPPSAEAQLTSQPWWTCSLSLAVRRTAHPAGLAVLHESRSQKARSTQREPEQGPPLCGIGLVPGTRSWALRGWQHLRNDFLSLVQLQGWRRRKAAAPSRERRCFPAVPDHPGRPRALQALPSPGDGGGLCTERPASPPPTAPVSPALVEPLPGSSSRSHELWSHPLCGTPAGSLVMGAGGAPLLLGDWVARGRALRQIQLHTRMPARGTARVRAQL